MHNMLKLHSPRNEAELALLKGILDAEGINYFVRNDNFGSMEIGPRIELFNKKTIFVQEDQHERASELFVDFLRITEDNTELVEERYSASDKIRMAVEFLLFGWIMPGRRKRNQADESSSKEAL